MRACITKNLGNIARAPIRLAKYHTVVNNTTSVQYGDHPSRYHAQRAGELTRVNLKLDIEKNLDVIFQKIFNEKHKNTHFYLCVYPEKYKSYYNDKTDDPGVCFDLKPHHIEYLEELRYKVKKFTPDLFSRYIEHHFDTGLKDGFKYPYYELEWV